MLCRFFYLPLFLPAFLYLAFSGNFGIVLGEMLHGHCYDFDFPEDFKADEFSKSRWFEVGRYRNNFENEAECVYVTTNINTDEDTWTIYFNIPTPDGLVTIYGSVRPNNETDGYEAHFPDDSKWSSFTVVDTDYDNYSILYSCWQRTNGSLPEKQERLWVFGRSRQLSQEIQEKIHQSLQHDGDDLSRFIYTINQTCSDKV